MNVNYVNTPKKYEEKADEIISVLFGLLEELLTVQERYVLRYGRLEQKILPYNEKNEKRDEIFDKCGQEYAAVIAGKCTENEMKHKHPGSLGQTPEYIYIKGEYTVDFTMKKNDEVVVITHFNVDGRGKKHKFLLKLDGGKWLIDAVYSGYEGERKWYHTEL